ncbi:MAG: cation:proton antiporter [Patescibacteria group bacterium]
MSVGILELSVVLLIAALLGVVARFLRQPILVAYMATGALVAYLGFFDLVRPDTYQIFADLGITFLLFLVGLEVNYSSLRLVGRSSIIIGIGQILFTAVIGYVIVRAFDFAALPALYIALCLTFSSTIIIIKLLSEKKDLQSLYGKIVIGFMLVQDVIAILLLVILSSISSGQVFSVWNLLFVLIKGVALFVAMLWLGRRVFPIIFDRLARSGELLFLVSIAWALLVAAFAEQLGFSIVIGGFLAGIALSNSSEHFAITSKIKPLRDFFILVFFVILGASLFQYNFANIAWPVLALSMFVLIGNPLIVFLIMSVLGYRRSTSFAAGVTVAQVSEFSLILIALGLKIGHVDERAVALVSAVAVITILASTYLVLHAKKIAKVIDPALRYLERKKLIENNIPDSGYHMPIILIGAHRTGESILRHLSKEEVLIVDFDPDKIKERRASGYTCLLGNITDEDIFEASGITESKLIISTSPDFEDNLGLLELLSRARAMGKVIVRAETDQEAKFLYKAGASYVIFPHKSVGQFLGKHLQDHPDLAFLNILKKNDLASLK